MRAQALLGLLLCLFPSLACALPANTYVLAIGNNRGDAGDIQLLYAERDAREMAEVLRGQGGIPSDRVQLLIDENADTVRRALLGINTALRAHSGEGGPPTALLVFYSGHADADALHLRGTQLPFEEIRGLVTSSPATVRLFIIDACRSGTVTRVKGMRPAPEFKILIENHMEAEGTAIISSSTADESSQESDRLRGSFFSHHLVNAMRGAADRNGDGRVSLTEAYEYTYAQTLRSSGQTLYMQHPTYSYDVKGSGDLILTTLTDNGSSRGRLRLSSAGTYLIADERETGVVVAELTTVRDHALISLPSGHYFVQRRGSLEYREYQVMLPAGSEVNLEQLPYRALGYDQLVRKRGGTRRSIHGIMALVGARGEVLSGEGVTPNLVLGYNADLPWLTVGVRLRGDTAGWNSVDGLLPVRRYELGLAGVLQRYIDLPWFSVAFGLSIEAVFEAERFDNTMRQTAPRNTLAVDFAALFALERRLYGGLSLRVEGGPLAMLDHQAVIQYGQQVGDELSSVFTFWAAGGLAFRF
jgi:hypothetical protein